VFTGSFSSSATSYMKHYSFYLFKGVKGVSHSRHIYGSKEFSNVAA